MNKTTLTNCIFNISDFEQTKEKVLNWAQQFDTFCFLDNHQYQIAPHSLECLLGAGAKRSLKLGSGKALEQLQSFIEEKECWRFGHLGYDLKNEIEQLNSRHPDSIGFPDLFFFEPEIVIRFSANEMFIEAGEPQSVFDNIFRESSRTDLPGGTVKTLQRFSKDEYISVIKQLKGHILRGDCYEINFCQEFFARDVLINPVGIYMGLSRVSPNPFSALYRVKDRWLICASPERFLRKQGNKILSQPIKGTSGRNLTDEQKDNQRKEELKNSSKDRSENVMVVDIVRNDLSRICVEGKVKVDELFGIYSFPQVHQMISTVSGELKKDILFSEIIRAVFPMGSMTGAPKKRVMELIEQYERTRRGIFSGALGYISPGGDFDFNVVIRSIMYNAASTYLSFPAGSGITFYSDPEKEWEECLLKAAAIEKVLTGRDEKNVTTY